MLCTEGIDQNGVEKVLINLVRPSWSITIRGDKQFMAKKEIVQVIDDLDGKVLDQYETVRWSLDGKNYEFDTSSKHAQQFRDSLSKYLDISRQTGRVTKRAATTATAAGGGRNKETTKAIREWAIREGYELSDRGRIPQSIIEAFEAAH
jgi:hypothetical protein